MNNCKHPQRVYLRRGVMPKPYEKLMPFLKRYSAVLLADRPGATAVERQLVNVGEIAYGVRLIVLEEAKRHGFIVKQGDTWDLSPGVKDLAKFLAIERQVLQTLGLERRAKAVPALADYIDAQHKTDTEPHSNHHTKEQSS